MKLKFIICLNVLFILATGCDNSGPADIVPKLDNLDMRKEIVRNFDANQDGKLSPDEVKHIKEIDLDYYVEGDNLEGIKYLTEMTDFSSNGAKIQNLNLSANKNLCFVDLMNMPNLREIKVNKSLQGLALVRIKKLYSLDLGSMPFLYYLVITESPLELLEIGECPSLVTLNLNETRLKNIDLTKFPRLETLFCSETLIKEIDLSSLKNLQTARLKGIKKIYISPDQKIEGLNVMPDYEYVLDKDAEIIVK